MLWRRICNYFYQPFRDVDAARIELEARLSALQEEEFRLRREIGRLSSLLDVARSHIQGVRVAASLEQAEMNKRKDAFAGAYRKSLLEDAQADAERIMAGAESYAQWYRASVDNLGTPISSELQ